MCLEKHERTLAWVKVWRSAPFGYADILKPILSGGLLLPIL